MVLRRPDEKFYINQWLIYWRKYASLGLIVIVGAHVPNVNYERISSLLNINNFINVILCFITKRVIEAYKHI